MISPCTPCTVPMLFIDQCMMHSPMAQHTKIQLQLVDYPHVSAKDGMHYCTCYTLMLFGYCLLKLSVRVSVLSSRPTSSPYLYMRYPLAPKVKKSRAKLMLMPKVRYSS